MKSIRFGIALCATTLVLLMPQPPVTRAADLGPTGAAPGDKLKALIIDGQNNTHPEHSGMWKATTPLLKAMLEASGRFTVEVLTSPPSGSASGQKEDWSKFNPDFTKYKVVVSNYNGAMWPEPVRTAFEAYVKNGGGFVSVHAADNAFPQWPEYNKMIAVGGWGDRNEQSGPYLRLRDGKFVRDDKTPGPGGSHGAVHAYPVETRAAEHPIMRGLPEKWMHADDELYDRLRGPAENVTVLATAYSDKKLGGTDEHEPVLMVIDYGKGRVFHTALGHDPGAMRCAGFITTLTRGAEWAATGEVTIPKPEDFPPADKVVRRELEPAATVPPPAAK